MHDLHRLLIGMWPTELNHTNLNEQSDSHDFYLGLVDIFHSQLARNGFPLFRSILATKVRHTITCPDCHHTTSNSSYEPSLEINLPSGRNAERRLAALIYPAETLDDYRCQGPVCIQPAGRVRKTEHIVNAPDILTVHIRRFVYNRQTGAQSKDSSWVNIPVHLDLTDHYDGQAKERLMYRLIGSVLHRGSPHGGHYICVAEGPNGNWHELEDHRVRDASIDGIIARPRFGFTPYMLFYERQL
ncbi:hypothetical protein MMC24_005522 [Lignoscripta atroalba]|nr:hypothetical protein [Lignoscripta atroalba]